VATSAGTLTVAGFWHALAKGEEPTDIDHVALQVPAVHGDQVLVDERFVEAAHRHRLAVHVWTINDETEMERLLDLGVDGIISDVPTTLVGVLDRRGVAWRLGGAGRRPRGA
jgi:glycerophosphoryl diester phosphodiesterase